MHPPVSLLLSALALTACTTTTTAPAPAAGPSGPCAATREQPPDGSGEQRLQADLDGDGRSDEVVSWMKDGNRVVQAWLSDGRNAEPEAVFAGDLLAAADADGDGRAEVFAATAATSGGAFRLVDCRLEAITLDGAPWQWPLAPTGTALICLGNGGLQVQSTQPTGTLVRSFILARGAVTPAGERASSVPVPTGAPVRC